MELTVELEQETDGRWIAEVRGCPGEVKWVAVYGETPLEAAKKALELALEGGS